MYHHFNKFLERKTFPIYLSLFIALNTFGLVSGQKLSKKRVAKLEKSSSYKKTTAYLFTYTI